MHVNNKYEKARSIAVYAPRTVKKEKELTPECKAPICEEARELFQRTNNNDGESTERTIKYNARDEPAL